MKYLVAYVILASGSLMAIAVLTDNIAAMLIHAFACVGCLALGSINWTKGPTP